MMRIDRRSTFGPGETSRALAWLVAIVAVVSLAATTPAAAQSPAPEGEGTLEAARSALEEDRYADAGRLVDAILAEDPDDPEALRLRAEIFRSQGELEKAREASLEVTRVLPDDVGSWFWLATVERWLGLGEEAAVHYGRALEISPRHTDSLVGRARVLRRAGDTAGAEADLRTALEIDPDHEVAAELLAGLYAASDRMDEALEVLEGVFSGPELDLRVAGALAEAGRIREALSRYRALADSGYETASLYQRIGDLERERGETRKALRAYGRAVQLDPDDSRSMYWVGILSTWVGNFEVAIASFDALLAEDPEDVGSLLGKARALHFERRNEEALDVVDRALELRPDNLEARTLRARIVSSMGDRRAALRELRVVLEEDPVHGEARTIHSRLAEDRALGFWARSTETEVVEGLEDQGLLRNGVPIRPTRIRYLTEGGGASFAFPLGRSTKAEIDVSQDREAVFNDDQDRAIYDFDVSEAGLRIEHDISDLWSLAALVGAKRYESRRPGTIDEEDELLADLRIERSGPRFELELRGSRSPFVHRGFAGDFQFRIFTRDRFSIGWSRALARGADLEVNVAVDDYDDGNTPVSGSLGYEWHWRSSSFRLRYSHDPFPARFLTDENDLELIEVDRVFYNQRTVMGAGFVLEIEGGYLYYEETERTIEVNGEKVRGPLDNNTARVATVTLDWTPRSWEVLTLGTDYVYSDYDFDTGPYNTIDTEEWWAFVELEAEMGLRGSLDFRYGHGWISSERDDDYDSDEVLGRFSIKIGSLRSLRAPARLVFQGRYKEQVLVAPDGEEFEEKYPRAEVFLTIPL